MSAIGIAGLIISALGAGASADAQQKGRKMAKRSAKEQKEQMFAQEQEEKKRLAEAESEIARRKALRQGGGRSLLLAPQAQQGSQTIGG